jgi:hypothetical protein
MRVLLSRFGHIDLVRWTEIPGVLRFGGTGAGSTAKFRKSVPDRGTDFRKVAARRPPTWTVSVNRTLGSSAQGDINGAMDGWA